MPAMSFKRPVSVIALIAAAALAGCETTGTGSAAGASPARSMVNDLPDAPLGDDPVSQATYWGARYEANPGNSDLAVRFSKALRGMGSLNEAGSLMARTMLEHPSDVGVLTEYSRVMLSARQGGDALGPIAQAISREPDNWELHSLEGVAYDQVGDFANATQSYERALAASPNNPNVLNNYGLSRALAGDPEGAEMLLRAAVAEPGATMQMRQNLALVLGVQGKFDEAGRVSRADLPPEAVENNVAYYRAMLTQPSAWNELEDGEDAGNEDAGGEEATP